MNHHISDPVALFGPAAVLWCSIRTTTFVCRSHVALSPVVLGLCLLVLATPGVGSTDLNPQGPAVPAVGLSSEQREHFLLRAKIGKSKVTKIGITGSRCASLSDGTMTHQAHIQTVDIYKPRFKSSQGTEIHFRDYHGFNVAAYRLDKLLGLNLVPVTVARRFRGDLAAVAWWVDEVMMDGVQWKKKGFTAPVAARLRDQRAQGLVFQQLIFNTDPNLGNEVIDRNWKYWIFDFTRAFRRWDRLQNPACLRRIGRGFLSRLWHLDAADVERELGPHLRPAELKGLLARRDLLVQHFDRLIAERGEAAVLIDGPGF